MSGTAMRHRWPTWRRSNSGRQQALWNVIFSRKSLRLSYLQNDRRINPCHCHICEKHPGEGYSPGCIDRPRLGGVPFLLGNRWPRGGAFPTLGKLRSGFQESGGEGGIRTPDTRQGMAAFEAARFNRSRTSPRRENFRLPNQCNTAAIVQDRRRKRTHCAPGVGGRTPAAPRRNVRRARRM